jgi:hypothetical protein
MDRAGRRLADLLAARGVAPESLTLAGLVVSVAAGLALAAGGATREPRLWLLVPALGVVRLALHALGTLLEERLVDCRRSIPLPEERTDGER